MNPGSRPSSAAGGAPYRLVSGSQMRGRSDSRQSSHSRRESVGRNAAAAAAAATATAEEDETIAAAAAASVAKTAVKVAVRVRPPLDSSDPAFDLIPNRFRGSTCQVSNPSTLTIESAQGKKLFLFDRVFSQTEKQKEVWEYVSEGVNAFVKGYNVSVMAYGQSGAGKSYTMGTSSPGEQQAASDKGIIPRAAAALFEKLAPASSLTARTPNGSSGIRPPSRYTQQTSVTSSKAEDRSWQLKATYVEIYNEQLRDLLLPDSIPLAERSTVAIREDTKGRIILTGLHQVSINSIEDLMQALNFGSSIRQTDATMVNSQSSRSHAVFSLNLVQKKPKASLASTDRSTATSLDASADGTVTIDSKLHFVDLAGSERLKNTGLKGGRVKEGISINAGLAALGKVISQLSSKHGGAHISYRDSKLTRLLQDSLGGNAITYMVACINPVEFHLSETLNTVQYAQRARAIQSKPQIQHRVEEGDKHLIIERLRAEIAFLRDQARNTQRAERRSVSATQQRTGRKHDRENELQDQLLDVQENYSALSQRHAKLIAELAKGKNEDVEQLPALKGALQNASLDRLHRSSTFADDVEHVVLEYEKTIHSLETALSNTRASLATSEGTLLEREAKIVYMDAVTQQLQARIQKALDRETTSESYVRELESKLDGISNGEERHLVIIQDLRKELARIRESEASAEDYISTLEERLAEAEQDTDLMQREMNRLENVIERQRSIGKLDNLLSDLDKIQQKKPPVSNNNASKTYEDTQTTDAFHDRLVATAAGSSHPNDEMLADDAEAEWKSFGPMEGDGDDDDRDDDDDDSPSEYTAANSEYSEPKELAAEPNGLAKQMPPRVSINGEEEYVMDRAQAKALVDKLETTALELFDLRVDHETAVVELEDVSRKYEVALSTLSRLQDAVDGPREPRPNGQTNTNGISGSNGIAAVPGTGREDAVVVVVGGGGGGGGSDKRNSTSRTIASAMSSHDDSPTLVDASEVNGMYMGRPDSKHALRRPIQDEEMLVEAIKALKRANAEKDIDVSTLTENYAQLQDQHQDSLNYIEELKEEMQRAQAHANALAPDRRKSAMGKDREARVFGILRSIGAQNIPKNSKDSKNFETNITALFTDSRLRSDRIHTLEAEVAAARRELGVKNSMITGLAKERSSQSNSMPLDVSLILSMRQHLLESQRQMTAFHELSATHEQDLANKTEQLITGLTEMLVSNAHPDGDNDDDNNNNNNKEKHDDVEAAGQRTLLEKAIAAFVADHEAHLQSTLTMDQDLIRTIDQLESSLRNAEHLHNERIAARALRADIQLESSGSDYEAERARHLEQVTALQREIDGYKATADSHAAKLLHLENSYSQIIQEVEEDAKNRDITENELQTHRELVSNLEAQIDQQKSLSNFHQQGLKSLQETHSAELEELRGKLRAQQEKTSVVSAEQSKHHEEAISILEGELTKAHMELAQFMQSVSLAFNEEIEPAALHTRLQTLVEDNRTMSDQQIALSKALEVAQQQVSGSKRQTIDLVSKVSELTSLHDETIKELEKSAAREKRNTTVVSELEEQLKQAFDLQQKASARLSTTQKGRVDLEKELEDYKTKVNVLETQLAEMKDALERRPSNASNLRHSSSVASLPSPPPSVPLPPLPHSSAIESAPSPPGSRHTSKEVSSIAAATAAQARDAMNAQQIEELENRLRVVEKHLFAEKQLTHTLEEALVDLETSANRTKADAEGWKKKCREIEEEASGLRRERGTMRNSLQAVEEERERRKRAEDAQRQLQERMEALNQNRSKKKKQNALNCF